MKKVISLALSAALCASVFAGCGKQNSTSSTTEATAPSTVVETTQAAASQYGSSLDLLNAIWNGIPEGSRFPAGGGDEANAAEGPGSFDVAAYAETFQYLILVDQDLQDKITDEAATLVHMMNTNTFCSAVMQLKDTGDAEDFAAAYKEIVQGNQWMCGFPDTVLVLNLDGFVITAYGKNDPIQSFKNAAVALGAQLLVEAPTEV